MINNGRVSHDIRVKKMCRKLFINLNLIKFIILDQIFFSNINPSISIPNLPRGMGGYLEGGTGGPPYTNQEGI